VESLKALLEIAGMTTLCRSFLKKIQSESGAFILNLTCGPDIARLWRLVPTTLLDLEM
jgi:hypothetical protein